MNQPLPSPLNPPPVSAPNQAAIYAERAMTIMRSLAVLPTPKNYSIFFGFSAGQPTEMVQEIERMVQAKTHLSEEVLDGIYTTYIAESQTRAIQDTALNARKILTDMIRNVTEFAGTTTATSQEVSQKLVRLDGDVSEDMVRLLADTLMKSARSMQDSSESMTERLAGAQLEITQLRENLAQVMTEAERDFLTGCYNRKAFDKRLNDHLAEAKQKETALTLMMIDIDHFKTFNDTHGHLIGDEVLKIVARTLTDMLKGLDFVARYGGEEFAVILPSTPIAGGMVVAESIRKAIASKELKRKNSGENFGVISISMGVAGFRRQEDTALTLIKRADEALYRSKHAGRNRVTQEQPAA